MEQQTRLSGSAGILPAVARASRPRKAGGCPPTAPGRRRSVDGNGHSNPSRNYLSVRRIRFQRPQPIASDNCTMPQPRQLHQRTPHRVHQIMLDQQMPEAIRALVQIRHRQIQRHSAPIFRPAPPDRSMRKQPLINPSVSVLQFLGRHVPGLKHGVRRIVLRPISMQNPPLGFHLAKQRRRRIRRQDVKGSALQTILLDPFRRAREYVFPIMIESQHETIHSPESRTSCSIRTRRA